MDDKQESTTNNIQSQETEESQQISLSAILHRCWHKKIKLLIVFVVAFGLSCLWIMPEPRFYTSSLDLAPELGLPNSNGGGLASIASSMGFNVSSGVIGDAISPELYPDLMKSNKFVMSLINCRVVTNDGAVDTTYYQYLSKHQKTNSVKKAVMKPFGLIAGLFTKDEPKGHNTSDTHAIDPFKLTKDEDEIFSAIKDNIGCSVDKKTNVITITATDQDPLIAATMAEEARKQLQNFITDYRTSKARNDVNYYKKLTQEAKAKYEKVRREYVEFSDANTDVTLESVKSKQEDLENDMQLKFNTYSSLNNQYQAAEAKLQEKTPAFTVLRSASVPLLPAGPKRMIFVFGMTLLSLLVAIVILSRDLIF